ESSRLRALWDSYRERGVRFVGVDYEDGRGAATAFARSLHMSYPSVIDANGTLGSAFGIFGLPMTYIIGPDERIRYVVVGKVDPAPFRAALDSVLGMGASVPPTAPSGSTLG